MRIDRNRFIAWLQAKQPDEIVGENRDCHSCPIAKFYWDATGGHEIVIFQDAWGGYTVDRGYSKRPLPPWAASFVFQVDGDSDGKISARRALEVVQAY